MNSREQYQCRVLPPRGCVALLPRSGNGDRAGTLASLRIGAKSSRHTQAAIYAQNVMTGGNPYWKMEKPVVNFLAAMPGMRASKKCT
jgi:hypothetical protein